MEFLEALNETGSYLFILPVTLDCNLNCYGCYAGCSIDRKNAYELDIDSLDLALSTIESVCKHCSGFILTGGEPFLRKDIVHICQKIKELCPQKSITINTNGTLLHTLSDSDVEWLIKNHVLFSITFYPDSRMLAQTLETMSYLDKKGAALSLWDRSRPYFLKMPFNLGIEKNGILKNHHTNEIGCGHQHETTFTLMDNRVFGCDGILFFKNKNILINEKNYVSIDDLQSEEQIYSLKYDDDLCRRCKSNSVGNPYVIWHTQKELGVTNSEDDKTLMNIFCYEYEKYKKLQDNNEKLLGVIDNPYFDRAMVRYNKYYGYTKYLTRYLHGNVDICFIFNQENIPNRNNLMDIKQKIKDFIDKQNNNLYIICDNLNVQQQEEIYQVFAPSIGVVNTYLIKCDNREDGIKYFLNNSFSPYYCICDNITLMDCNNFKNIIQNFQEKRLNPNETI